VTNGRKVRRAQKKSQGLKLTDRMGKGTLEVEGGRNLGRGKV